MPLVPLATESPEALATAPGTTIIYKHSPTCSLCAWSVRELRRLADEDGLTIHQVDVFAQRALSNAIESRFSVRHESPQVLILQDGALQWHGSHRALSAERVRAALRGSTQGAGARF
jgi:bacillithiol system protein YtxJ